MYLVLVGNYMLQGGVVPKWRGAFHSSEEGEGTMGGGICKCGAGRTGRRRAAMGK